MSMYVSVVPGPMPVYPLEVHVQDVRDLVDSSRGPVVDSAGEAVLVLREPRMPVRAAPGRTRLLTYSFSEPNRFDFNARTEDETVWAVNRREGYKYVQPGRGPEDLVVLKLQPEAVSEAAYRVGDVDGLGWTQEQQHLRDDAFSFGANTDLLEPPKYFLLPVENCGVNVHAGAVVGSPSSQSRHSCSTCDAGEDLGTMGNGVGVETKAAMPDFKKLVAMVQALRPNEDTATKKKGKGSSAFLGVSRHKKSGRYEAHVWVPADGKQVYLGGFESAAAAACAYDLVAIKVKRASMTNFPLHIYASHDSWIQSTGLAEIVSTIKRQSGGFSRGQSQFRGVTQHPNGRWEARIGVGAKRHIYLGLYSSEERAARHYDEALVRMKGPSGATNFPVGRYARQIKEHQQMEQALASESSMLWKNKSLMKWIKDGNSWKRLDSI